jgi:inorganic triphosphatase YgiF
MGADGREVELKFHVDAAQGPEIIARLEAGAASPVRILTSIYYDTAGRALRRAGFVLRIRREGRRWIQTLKSRANIAGALGRGEWEAIVPKGFPEFEPIRLTPAGSALRRGAGLKALFKIVVRRRSVMVERSGSAVEVSFDVGEAVAGPRGETFCELELELKSGSAQALFALAERLSEAFVLTLSFTAKADRGFALLSGRGARAAHFEAPQLGPNRTTGEAFRAQASAALAQIATNAQHLRAHPSTEGVHQLRVGTRRLRGALATFEPVVADDEAKVIKAELKWLTGELDRARNLDVFLAGAFSRARKDDRAGTAALGRRLRAEGAAAYERAKAAAASGRLRILTLGALKWIHLGAWTSAGAPGAALRDEPAADFAARTLKRERARIARKGEDLATLSRHARHKVRIRAKTLRYATEGFAPLFGEHAGRCEAFIEALEDLQDHLGDLNDIVGGERLIDALAAAPLAADLKAAGEAREADLIERAQAAIDALAQAKPFWR